MLSKKHPNYACYRIASITDTCYTVSPKGSRTGLALVVGVRREMRLALAFWVIGFWVEDVH